MQAIAPKLEEAEIARTRRYPTESLDAYDNLLRGLAVGTRCATKSPPSLPAGPRPDSAEDVVLSQVWKRDLAPDPAPVSGHQRATSSPVSWRTAPTFLHRFGSERERFDMGGFSMPIYILGSDRERFDTA